MKFCTNMYLDNLKNPIEFQGHESKVKTQDHMFCFFAATRGQYLALSKAWRSCFNSKYKENEPYRWLSIRLIRQANG